jgi:phage terminase large subunit-like protein
MSWIASLPENEREEVVGTLVPSEKERQRFFFYWSLSARPDQLPPDDPDWLVWLLLAGRGFGKTRTGAETVRLQIEHGLSRRIALVAPTAADVRDVMVGGPSGILAVFPEDEKPVYEPSRRRIVFGNGAVAMCYSAERPNRLRGPQHDFAWGRCFAHGAIVVAWPLIIHAVVHVGVVLDDGTDGRLKGRVRRYFTLWSE